MTDNIFVLPLRNDLNFYEYNVELNGTVFIVGFRYNLRMDRWIIDISDINSNPLIMGVPALAGMKLLKQYIVAGKPLGDLIVANWENDKESPTHYDFGDAKKVSLLFEEA